TGHHTCHARLANGPLPTDSAHTEVLRAFILPVRRRPPRPTLFPYTTLFRSSSRSPVNWFQATNSRWASVRVWPYRRRTRSVAAGDRKSTRLNSSHVSISYAVFCLKKKTTAIFMGSGYSTSSASWLDRRIFL